MRPAHIQQTQHEKNSRTRQNKNAEKSQTGQTEKGGFKKAERAEIRGPPFRYDRQQFAKVEDFGRAQQCVQSVWSAAAGRQGTDCKEAPPQCEKYAAVGSNIPDRYQRDGRDQRQSQDEAAMKISPERHQRQQKQRWRSATIGS